MACWLPLEGSVQVNNHQILSARTCETSSINKVGLVKSAERSQVFGSIFVAFGTQFWWCSKEEALAREKVALIISEELFDHQSLLLWRAGGKRKVAIAGILAIGTNALGF